MCWPAIMRDADGVVLVYNPDNRAHEKEIEIWHEFFCREAGIDDSKCLALAHTPSPGPKPRPREFTTPLPPTRVQCMAVSTAALALYPVADIRCWACVRQQRRRCKRFACRAPALSRQACCAWSSTSLWRRSWRSGGSGCLWCRTWDVLALFLPAACAHGFQMARCSTLY